jgi:hypothetical protein
MVNGKWFIANDLVDRGGTANITHIHTNPEKK